MTGLLLRNRLLLIAVALLLTTVSSAQTLTLIVLGEVTKPLALQPVDFKAMLHTEITAADRDGKEHRYAGVPLISLLNQAGASTGAALKGKNLTKYVVVKAADGYEVVFALAELDPDFSTRTILLADSVDGAPLADGLGPYRVVVPGEKKPARWIRQVTAIEVKLAK